MARARRKCGATRCCFLSSSNTSAALSTPRFIHPTRGTRAHRGVPLVVSVPSPFPAAAAAGPVPVASDRPRAPLPSSTRPHRRRDGMQLVSWVGANTHGVAQGRGYGPRPDGHRGDAARRGVARLRMTTSSSLAATASQSITPPKRGRAPSGWRYSFACVLLRLPTHLGSASAASAMRSGTL